MPRIERWENCPEGVRQYLIDRMRDRAIGIGDWYKDFGSFKIRGRGALAKTFLLRGQVAKGDKLH